VFTLPAGCTYVGPAVSSDSTQTTWRVDCGALDAKSAFNSALPSQGWRFCGGALGTDIYSKQTLRLNITYATGNPGGAAAVQLRTDQPACP